MLLMVLACLGFNDSRAAPPAPAEPEHRFVQVGAMVGLVSVPRPIDGELFVRFGDLVSVGVSYSDFPAFLADPLLDIMRAKSGSLTARLDDFSALEADLRLMPFRGAFFLGVSLGRQKLRGAVTDTATATTGTVDITTLYVTPRAGWLWSFSSGFLFGFDLGVQLKLSGDVTTSVPSTAPAEIKTNAQNFADTGSSLPLPSLHLRLGWML
jgi:hypothetical protein